MDYLLDLGVENGLNHLTGFGHMISDLVDGTGAEFTGIEQDYGDIARCKIRPGFVDYIGALDELLESNVLFT